MKRLIANQLKKGSVETIVYGEKIRCDLLVVRYPPVLQDRQRFVPHVEARDIRVIVNQPPMSDYGENAIPRYSLSRAAENLRHYFGKDGIWHPIGPAIRQTLLTKHADELAAINLSPEDWLNIIDTTAWRRDARPSGHRRPRIGRHARDHEMKWPDRDTLRKVYPDSTKYDVSIMGGASVPKKMFGKLPANWTVLPFDAVPAHRYLADLDVFLYYSHPGWVESFGRVIIEAMAVGVPVIVPPSYRQLFESAALYAEPDDALGIVDRLMADRNFYEEQVRTAQAYVERRFSHARHLERIRKIVGNKEH